MSKQMTDAPTDSRSACVNFGGLARERIAAAWRMEPLACGCRDPWFCRCHRSTYVRPEAAYAAHRHLNDLGLTTRWNT